MPIEYLNPVGDNTNSSTYGHGRGQHTAPGNRSLLGTPIAIYVNLDEPVGALDQTKFGWIKSQITASPANPGYFDFTFSVPPSAVVVNSVKLYGYLRSAQSGANQFSQNPQVFGYILPSGCAHTAGAATQHNGSTVTVTNNLNCNTNGPGGWALYTLGTWATNPHTAAAWTVADLTSGGLKAGIKANSPHIPYSVGSSANAFDCAQLYLELDVDPAESYYGPAKFLASTKLRLLRVPFRVAEFEVAAPLGDVEPGEHIWIVDRLYPDPAGDGVGIENWDRRPLRVLSATPQIEPPTTLIRALDMRPNYVSVWSTFRTDLGVTDINTGIPHIDRGGGYTSQRQDSGGTDQAGWVWQNRDWLYRQVAGAKPRFSPFGLMICGGEFNGSSSGIGELRHGPTYNTFSGGTGTTFTGWTLTDPATGTIAEDTTDILFDESGFRRAPKFTMGTPYTTDYVYLHQDWSGFTTNHRVRFQVKFTVHGVTEPDEVRFILQRLSDSQFWTPGTGFAASPSWIAPTQVGDGTFGYGSFLKVGDHHEYWSDEVQVGATTGLQLRVGYVAKDGGEVTVHAAGIVHNVAATAVSRRRVMRRGILATGATVLDQAADYHQLTNATDYKFADVSTGFVSLVFTPFFAHADLDDDHPKRLLAFSHDKGNLDYHLLFYFRDTSTTAFMYFQRVRGGGNVGLAQVTLTGSALAAYMVPMKIAARWVGPDEEHGLADRTLSVWVNGVRADTLATNDCRYDGSTSDLRIGREEGSTINPHVFADGAIADLEIWKGRCPSNTEVLRIQAEAGLRLDLPTILNP